MTEATIICPNCRTEIPLTESLAAPMLAATRRQFEQQLAQKDEDIAKREQGLRDKEKQLADAKRTLDEQIADQVAAQLQAERARVIAEEGKKARLASAAELDAAAHVGQAPAGLPRDGVSDCGRPGRRWARPRSGAGGARSQSLGNRS